MTPPILSEISAFLSIDFPALEDAEDGRIASALNEKTIIEKVSERFSVEIPKIRGWYDFAITDNGVFYPVNIKVSEFGNANDNLNCKLGIYYALTGRMPDFANEANWNKFFRLLSEGMRENDKDYYFLVINKQNTSDNIVQGLKTLSTLTPNGNNLPFQCCWINNRIPVLRTFAEARDFLLSTVARSVKLRANIYFDFHKYFSEYTEDAK